MRAALRRWTRLLGQKYRRDGAVSLLEYAFRYPAVGLLVAASGNEVESNGVRLDLDSDRIDLGTKGLVASGEYERAELELVRRHLPTDLPVVEVGGGVGYLACFVNGRLAEGTTHVVLEADPALVPVIERNAELNGCDFHVDGRAYSPTAEAVELFLHGSFKLGSAHRRFGRSTLVEGVDVQTVAEQYGVEAFVLILDVEGSEAELVASELAFLESNCAVLVVEFHYHYNDNPAAVRRAKRRLGDSDFVEIDAIGNVSVYENPALVDSPADVPGPT